MLSARQRNKINPCSFIVTTVAIVFCVFATIGQIGYAQEEATAESAEETDAQPQPEAAADTEQSQSVTPPAERIHSTYQRLLSEASTTTEPVWLEGAPSTLAFWRDDMSGNPQGAVIILHDLGQNPLWPETVQNLHQNLPKYGWGTLSVSLEPLPHATPPERTRAPPIAPTVSEEVSPSPDKDKSAEEGDVTAAAEVEEAPEAPGAATAIAEKKPSDKERMAETKSTNRQRLQSSVGFLHGKGYYNIALIGIGYGGHLALEYAEDHGLPLPTELRETGRDSMFSALITVDTDRQYKWVEPTQNLLTNPALPTFEVVTSPLPDVQAALKKRKQQSRKQQYDIYRQRTLMPTRGTLYQHQETELSKTIRGFLKRFAVGTEKDADEET